MVYALHFVYPVSQSLEAKRSNLRAVQQKLANLQAQFKENNNKKKQLEVDVDICSKKLDRYCGCLHRTGTMNFPPSNDHQLAATRDHED